MPPRQPFQSPNLLKYRQLSIEIIDNSTIWGTGGRGFESRRSDQFGRLSDPTFSDTPQISGGSIVGIGECRQLLIQPIAPHLCLS
jgi:hypothetical protein